MNIDVDMLKTKDYKLALLFDAEGKLGSDTISTYKNDLEDVHKMFDVRKVSIEHERLFERIIYRPVDTKGT